MPANSSCTFALPTNPSPTTAKHSSATRHLLCPDDSDVVDGALRAFLTLCLLASLALCGMHSGAARRGTTPAVSSAHLLAGVPAGAGTAHVEGCRL